MTRNLLYSSSSNSEYDIDIDANKSTSFVSYNEEMICRICHKINIAKIMIVPCACTESNEMVHTECLANYRKNSFNPCATTHCTLCANRYNYDTNYEFSLCHAKKLYRAILLLELIKFLLFSAVVITVAIFLNLITTQSTVLMRQL
jgi:E3 ubiquitin-protein ligase DOA10